ncbi:endopeptidase, partial [Myxococcus sp. CA056]|nr:endopeptidase [Myxococcus sp. CA056]
QNIGNKVFYQGSGNIGSWHACNCTAGTSDGCAATNGYKQWLAADDDNGNINDGTPHMTAIHAAFSRHNIACATPTPMNSGCTGGPTAKPTVTVIPAAEQVSLSWSPVAGATQYWVMKSDGVNGCTYGKARVATVTSTSYVDTEVLTGHNTCYSVAAAGSSAACYGASSTCTCVSPL